MCAAALKHLARWRDARVAVGLGAQGAPMRSIRSAALCLALVPASAAAQFTQLVSVDSSGVQGNNASQSAVISADGRYVAFHSYATNLVAGDTNNTSDIFERDLV